MGHLGSARLEERAWGATDSLHSEVDANTENHQEEPHGRRPSPLGAAGASGRVAAVSPLCGELGVLPEWGAGARPWDQAPPGVFPG